ncbi:MAG: hypothetical protein IPI49_00160 [Myxococcales bacterium]|nr:hypothetical protein [Myxococcales bacterium]
MASPGASAAGARSARTPWAPGAARSGSAALPRDSSSACSTTSSLACSHSTEVDSVISTSSSTSPVNSAARGCSSNRKRTASGLATCGRAPNVSVGHAATGGTSGAGRPAAPSASRPAPAPAPTPAPAPAPARGPAADTPPA